MRRRGRTVVQDGEVRHVGIGFKRFKSAVERGGSLVNALLCVGNAVVDLNSVVVSVCKGCAGGVLISIPISILFMVMQKFYVEGITSGGVKG